MADKKQTKVYLIPETESRDHHTYHYTVVKTRKFILENTKLRNLLDIKNNNQELNIIFSKVIFKYPSILNNIVNTLFVS